MQISMHNFHKTILLALALCLGQFSFGQEPVYKWGEPATNDFLERRIDKLLVLDNQGFVLLRKYTDNTFTSHYWLEYYSPELKLEGNVPVDFKIGVMGNSYDIENVAIANGIIYAFISHWDKAAGRNTLSIQELNLSGELKHLKDLDIIPAEKMGNRGSFKISISENEQNLLLLSEQAFTKKTNEKFRLSCFELPSLNQLWFHDQELAIESSRALHNDIMVDNKGRAFMFKKDYTKSVWTYFLYSFDGDSKWQEYPAKGMDGLTVLDLKLGVNKADQFYLFATYTKESSAYQKYLHGSWFFGLDANLNVRTELAGPWGTDLVKYFEGDRLANSPDKARLEDFYIKDILVKNDGSLLVLMEQLKLKQDMIAGSSPIQYSYEWNYGQFLALNINPENGNITWWQSFSKNQQVKNNFGFDEYGSFVYYLKEDRLFVLWNNTQLSIPSIPPANWTEPDGTRYVKHKAFNEKTVHGTFMHIIEPDGFLAYENRTFGLPLFNLHDGAVFEMSLTTPFFFTLNGDLVVLSTMHNGGKRFRFGFIGL